MLHGELSQGDMPVREKCLSAIYLQFKGRIPILTSPPKLNKYGGFSTFEKTRISEVVLQWFPCS